MKNQKVNQIDSFQAVAHYLLICFEGLAGEKLPVVKATLWGHAKAWSGVGHHWVRECIYQTDRITCKMTHKPTSQV